MSYSKMATNLTIDINAALKSIYTYKLVNAKIHFRDLIMRVEQELGENSMIAIKLNKKFMFALKHASKDDALWFLNERIRRCSQARFENFLLTQCIEPCKDDKAFLLLMNQDNPLKLLITHILIGYWYCNQQIDPPFGINMTALINHSLEKVSKLNITTDEDIYYLSYAFVELAFLSRLQGKTSVAIYYFRKALRILKKKNPIDYEACLTIYYYMLTYFTHLSTENKMKPNLIRIILKIMSRLIHTHVLVYDVRIIRQIFIQLSNAIRALEIDWKEINDIGDAFLMNIISLYNHQSEYPNNIHALTSLKDSPDYNNLKKIPDFFFIWIQLRSHTSTIFDYQLSDEDILIIFNDISLFQEGTNDQCEDKINTFHALSQICSHMKMYFYEELCCRETLRLSRRIFGDNHLKIVDSITALALVLLKQEKKEGKKTMAFAIQMYSHYLPQSWYNTTIGKKMMTNIVNK